MRLAQKNLIYTTIALNELYAGNPDTALYYLKKEAAISERLWEVTPPTGKIALISNYSYTGEIFYNHKHQIDSALHYLNKALKLHDELNFNTDHMCPRISSSLFTLSMIYYEIRDTTSFYDRVKRFKEMPCAKMDSITYVPHLNIHYRMGTIEFSMGRYKKAEREYMLADSILSLMKMAPPQGLQQSLWRDLSKTKAAQRKFDEAEIYLSKAIEYEEKVIVDDKDLLTYSMNLASLYKDKGDLLNNINLDSAYVCYAKSIEILDEFKKQSPKETDIGYFRVYLSIALNKRLSKDFKSSIKFYIKALKIHEVFCPLDNNQCVYETGKVLNELAITEREKKDYEKSRAHFHEAKETFEKLMEVSGVQPLAFDLSRVRVGICKLNKLEFGEDITQKDLELTLELLHEAKELLNMVPQHPSYKRNMDETEELEVYFKSKRL